MPDSVLDQRPIKPILPPITRPAPAPASTLLPPATLGGAIGCDFVSAQNQLLFVEYSGNLSRMSLYPAPSYEVLGTGYTTPEDVKASADGTHAYVTERTGDLVKVANRSHHRREDRGPVGPRERRRSGSERRPPVRLHQ